MWWTRLQPQVGQEGRLRVSNYWPVQGLAWCERYQRDDDDDWRSLKLSPWKNSHDVKDIKTNTTVTEMIMMPLMIMMIMMIMMAKMWRPSSLVSRSSRSRRCSGDVLADSLHFHLEVWAWSISWWSLKWWSLDMTALCFCVANIDDQYRGPSIKEKDSWVTN